MGLRVRQTAETSRTFTAADIADYVAIGGRNPANDEVPEPLLGALFSYLLGVMLPGRGTNYLKQETEFKGPARTGEPLIAHVEITRLRPQKQLVDLRTTCRNERGELICDGRALVHVKDVEQ